MKLSPERQREIDEADEWASRHLVGFIAPTTADLFRQWMVRGSKFFLDEPLGADDEPSMTRLIKDKIGVRNWQGDISPTPEIEEIENTIQLYYPLILSVEDEEIEESWPCIVMRIQPLDDRRCEINLMTFFPFSFQAVSSFLTRVSTTWPDIDMYTATRTWGGGQIGSPPAAEVGAVVANSKSDADDPMPLLGTRAKPAEWFAWFDWYYLQRWGAVSSSRMEHMAQLNGKSVSQTEKMHSLYMEDKRN